MKKDVGPMWDVNMGMSKWACPSVSHIKKGVGHIWDLHGNAQLGVPKCIPYENKYGSQLGTTWDCPIGGAQMYPI